MLLNSSGSLIYIKLNLTESENRLSRTWYIQTDSIGTNVNLVHF